MAYQNYPKTRACLVEQASWYDIQMLMREIKQIKKINFSIATNRANALERLGNLTDDAPYHATKRFPENANFVCDAVGDWSRKLTQLRSALSFKSYEKDIKSKDNDSRVGDYNDAHVSFINSITAITDQISRRDDVFDRQSFEVNFGATWADAA